MVLITLWLTFAIDTDMLSTSHLWWLVHFGIVICWLVQAVSVCFLKWKEVLIYVATSDCKPQCDILASRQSSMASIALFVTLICPHQWATMCHITGHCETDYKLSYTWCVDVNSLFLMMHTSTPFSHRWSRMLASVWIFMWERRKGGRNALVLSGQHILYSSRIARYTSSCVWTCIENGDWVTLSKAHPM